MKGIIYQSMQTINLLSLSLLLTPVALQLFGIQTQPSNKYDYLFSIEQFVPDFLVTMWFGNDKLEIQTFETEAMTLYFPGVFIECLVGMLQGIVLGLDLLHSPKRGNYNTPTLSSATLLCYAGMSASALPLHCLKEIPLFDITRNTMLTQSLFWVDTFCTSCVPPFMLISGLIECGYLHQPHQWLAWSVALINGTLTWIGVFGHHRWLMFFLHILYQPIFLSPLLYITGKRVKKLDCSHGYGFMVLAKVCSLVCAYMGFSFASPLSRITQGTFCPLTSVFVGCRIGMVQYWVFCKKQAECTCTKEKNC